MAFLAFVFFVFILFMVGLYELSLHIWPDQKMCDWEIQEDEEHGWI